MGDAGRVAFVLKGAYDGTVTYEKLDVVTYEGSSYAAKQATSGNLPTNTTYWQIVARSGTDTDYGTSSTTSATAAKVVTTTSGEFVRTTGANIVVKFANDNTASNPTINVDSTGAYAIYANNEPVGDLEAGVYGFVFTGTYYEMIGGTGGSGNANMVRATYEESPALYAHAVDDIIYYNEICYKVVTAILVGDTLAEGTNIETIDLARDTQVYIDNLPGGGGGKQQSVIQVDSTASVDNTPITKTVTVTAGDGVLSAVSSDTDVCTVSVSGTTLTITGVSSGTAVITVSISETENYYGTSATIVVTSTAVKIVPFSSGTVEEITSMVKAADEGKIDLSDYWTVGDEREVLLPAIASSGTYSGQSWTVGESQTAQSVTLVLMHKGLYELVTPVKDKSGASRSTCSFIVGLKDSLATGGYMNSSSTNSGSWESSARRAWCNGGFRGAMESIFGAGIFKQFKTKTISEYNGSSIQISNDYFALAAGAEVFKGDSTYGQGGTAGVQTAYSNLTEFNALTRFEYYETTANRVKKLGSSGSAKHWWGRSPYCYDANSFCAVLSNGNVGGNDAISAIGLAPFGCI